ncbi:hypothetical protein MKW92_036872, partial [Papaver armeniacum]
KRRDRHENFKASRGFIFKFKGRQRPQRHTFPVLRDDGIKIYTEKMEQTEEANASFRKHALNMVLDPAAAPTNEDPEVV